MLKRTYLIFVLLFTAGVCLASDVSFELTVDKNKVSLGDTVQLNLTFYGLEGISAPQLPEMDGFQSQYTGSSTSMSMVNGQVSNSITYIYTLLPLKAGVFKAGPFSIDYQGKAYSSNELTIEVVKGALSPNNQAQQENQGESIDLNNRVFLTLQAGKTTAYLNESVPITIKLYVNQLAIRDIQPPEFSHDGLSVESIKDHKQYKEVLGGVSYDVIEFNTAFFGIKPGQFQIGPAEIKCNLIVRKQKSRRAASSPFDDFFGEDVFDDFFGRFQTYPLSVKSAQGSITILALPEQGKPDDFQGAVGDFSLTTSLSPKELKAGDPITLKMVIEGRGNFNTVNSPRLLSQDGFKVYEPQVKQEGTKKTFEQVIMPESEQLKSAPELSFSFFNPDKAVYETLTAGAFPINVLKADKEEQRILENSTQGRPKETVKEELGRDIIYIKEAGGEFVKRGYYLYKNKLFLLLQLLPLIILVLVFIFHSRSEKLRTDIKYARHLQAPKKAKRGILKAKGLLMQDRSQEFYDAVFKTIQEYLGDKFHLPSSGITIDIIDSTLSHKGISQEMLDKLKGIFRDCDTARYADGAFDKSRMQLTFKELEEVIDYLQRQKL